MYKFRLKEIEVGDTVVRKGVRTTVSDVDPETGAITYDVENVANFSSTYKALQQAKEFLNTLEKTGKAKDDTTIDKFAEDIAKLFNAFRTHVRKNYPKEYERVSRLKEDYNPDQSQLDDEDEIFMPMDDDGRPLGEQSSTSQGGATFTPGGGAQYATPFAFRKKGKKSPSIYYYKLGYKPVPKKIKGAGTIVKQLFEYNDFQENRIKSFDDVESKIDVILPMLSNAKNKTAEYYNENPGSYKMVYPTDAMLAELDNIIKQLKQANEDANRSI
jgi:hypothetical protein